MSYSAVHAEYSSPVLSMSAGCMPHTFVCAAARVQVSTQDVLPCTGLLHQHQAPCRAVQKCNKGKPVGVSEGGAVCWGVLGSRVCVVVLPASSTVFANRQGRSAAPP